MAAWSAFSDGPNSCIFPKTAQADPPRSCAKRANVRSAAAIDSGLALYESLIISRPSNSKISIRHLLASSAIDRAPAI